MALSADHQGIDKYRQEALRTGPSSWANLAGNQQGYLAKQAKSAGAQTVAGQNAQAMSDLAMRGGVDSGARERIATSGANNLLNMNQKVNEDQSKNVMQIGMNDEQNRISQLGALPGLENEALKPQMFNVSNQMNNNQSHNQFDMDQYKAQMEEWAASKQAEATANAGKK